MAKPLVRRSVITYQQQAGYIYIFMSTQIEEEGNEEGVEDVIDGLIDSLIDAVYFDDLVLEKDVADL